MAKNKKAKKKTKVVDRPKVKTPSPARKKVKKLNMAGTIKVYCACDAIVAVDDLIPNPDNPNFHPVMQIERLAKIIANGWRQPITVSRRSGMIVKGHGRLEAAILLETPEVPVDYQDYKSDAEEMADLLADNRLAELAMTDTDMLETILSDDMFEGFDIELTGYDEAPDDLIDSIQNEGRVIPDMEKRLYEHHDYIVIVFDQMHDFLKGCSVLGVRKVNAAFVKGQRKIGIGRVVKGKKFLELIE